MNKLFYLVIIFFNGVGLYDMFECPKLSTCEHQSKSICYKRYSLINCNLEVGSKYRECMRKNCYEQINSKDAKCYENNCIKEVRDEECLNDCSGTECQDCITKEVSTTSLCIKLKNIATKCNEETDIWLKNCKRECKKPDEYLYKGSCQTMNSC